jgi:hypothetical protein
MTHLSNFFISLFLISALDESKKIVDSMGGWCRAQIVDISRREEVYKAAEEIKNEYGNVSCISMTRFSFSRALIIPFSANTRAPLNVYVRVNTQTQMTRFDAGRCLHIEFELPKV